jgi:hypothetical protein
VVVGLIEKGMAKKDSTGFVQEGIDSWQSNQTQLLLHHDRHLLRISWRH